MNVEFFVIQARNILICFKKMTIEILYKSSFRSVKEYCRLKKYCYIELMVGRKTNKTLPISWTDQ
jgi:hypothetical protein